MYEAMVRFRKKDSELVIKKGILKADLDIIKKNIVEFTNQDGNERHSTWVNSILDSQFSFNLERDEKIEYISKGKGSWKHIALDTDDINDNKNKRYDYNPNFLKSNWKYFHDALQKHRFEVLHDILPKYGICGV